MVLKSIGALSCGKVLGALYACIGLIIGAIFSLVSLVGSIAGWAASESPEALFGVLFGLGAVIVLPIFYGVIGFVGGLLGALVYNLIARYLGGIEVELE